MSDSDFVKLCCLLSERAGINPCQCDCHPKEREPEPELVGNMRMRELLNTMSLIDKSMFEAGIAPGMTLMVAMMTSVAINHVQQNITEQDFLRKCRAAYRVGKYILENYQFDELKPH